MNKKKYTKETFAEKVESYLSERGIKNEPVTLVDFCSYAKVHADYISEHDKNDGSDGDFSESIKTLRTEAKRSLEFLGLTGKINPTMAIFLLKANYGYRDASESPIQLNGDVIVKLPEPEQNKNLLGPSNL